MAVTVFMIDPPWPQKKGGLRSSRPNQDRIFDYGTMSIEAIFLCLKKEIPAFCNGSDHSVFLWSIDKFLTESDAMMRELGYKRHIRMVWDKLNGIAPAFTVRFAHEYLCWYYKKKLPPIARSMRGKIRSVFQEKAREHSRKPDIAYDIVSELYPDAERMDMFSRESRAGWVCWGNEKGLFDR